MPPLRMINFHLFLTFSWSNSEPWGCYEIQVIVFWLYSDIKNQDVNHFILWAMHVKGPVHDECFSFYVICHVPLTLNVVNLVIRNKLIFIHNRYNLLVYSLDRNSQNKEVCSSLQLHIQSAFKLFLPKYWGIQINQVIHTSWAPF